MSAARGGLKPVQARLHLSKISAFTPVQVSTCVFLSACLARSACALCRRGAVDPMPAERGGLKPVHGPLRLSKISPFTPVEVYTLYFSVPASPGQPGAYAGGTRWTQARPRPFTIVQNLPFYTRRSVYMVFLNAGLARSACALCNRRIFFDHTRQTYWPRSYLFLF